MKKIFNSVSRIMQSFIAVIFLFTLNSLYSQDGTELDPDPLRFEKQIDTFIKWDQMNSFPARAVLFSGSSSIRLWFTSEDFPDLPVINRGFGGAHISDLLYYFDQTVSKYQPSVIVIYCGDNDIAGGKSAGRVYDDFLKFITKMHDYLPGTKLIYLPIKPSLSRWEFWPEMQKANRLIEQFIQKNDDLLYIDTATPLLSPDNKPKQFLFKADSLHLNQNGYQIWQSALNQPLNNLYR